MDLLGLVGEGLANPAKEQPCLSTTKLHAIFGMDCVQLWTLCSSLMEKPLQCTLMGVRWSSAGGNELECKPGSESGPV